MPDSLDCTESQESNLYKQLRQLKMYCDNDSNNLDGLQIEQNIKQNSRHQSEQFKQRIEVEIRDVMIQLQQGAVQQQQDKRRNSRTTEALEALLEKLAVVDSSMFAGEGEQVLCLVCQQHRNDCSCGIPSVDQYFRDHLRRMILKRTLNKRR